jgi:hypothetical protein
VNRIEKGMGKKHMGFYTKRLSLVDMMLIQVMVSLLRMFF